MSLASSCNRRGFLQGFAAALAILKPECLKVDKAWIDEDEPAGSIALGAATTTKTGKTARGRRLKLQPAFQSEESMSPKKIVVPDNGSREHPFVRTRKMIEMTLQKKQIQRTVNVVAARENVGSKVVQQSGIQCFNCKEYGYFAKECKKPKKVKDSAYHKEKMLLCKQAEQGVPLQAEQYDLLADMDEEVDEQELEAHYSYMAKIQEVLTADSGTDSEPVEKVQNEAGYNVFANHLQHSEQSESVSNTCLVETDDGNVTPDSPNMCEDDIQNDQNHVESDDGRVALANLKLDTKQTEFEKYKELNDRTVNYDKLEQIIDNAWIKHSKDQFRAPTAQDMEILIRTCLTPLAIKTQNDSFKFVHELKQEMHADLKYVESLEKEIDELESDKAGFSDMYDVVKECDCLAQKFSKQTKSVSKKVHTELLQRFAKLEKHSISLEIALQKCKEQGKSVDTKFDRPSVVRQPNAQRIPKPLVLGKPTTFSNSLDRIYFQKTRSVPKANVSEGLSKPVTVQTLPQTSKKAVRVNHKPTVSRPQLKSNQSKDKVLPKISQVKAKKTQVEVHPRIPSVSNKMKSVTTCKDNLNSRTLNANDVCATCNKCLVDSNHFACVTKMLNGVHARTKEPNIIQLILFIVDSRCTKHMTGNLKLLCNFVEKFLGTVRFGNDQFARIPGYGDLVQGNVMINQVYYVEGLNHNLFSVGQFCDADLEVAFRKSTCFVRDLQGNDLLIGNRGSDRYTISLQESTSSTLLCLMAKATPTQAWLWYRRLSHLNFDYINLLSKKDIVIGLPKLKYVKDQLCSSCELSKAKRSSLKSKVVTSLKGRLNLLHIDLCGPMRVASINKKKYILVIVDDYSRYTDGKNLDKMKEKEGSVHSGGILYSVKGISYLSLMVLKLRWDNRWCHNHDLVGVARAMRHMGEAEAMS
nr:retrovirus-related Pol polyprotein from transposon TNT 1-94 [Tanacetum cinerariifolium]